ncbi:branched-chain amino acid ABC transporter permease [Chloroflexota bacterium]
MINNIINKRGSKIILLAGIGSLFLLTFPLWSTPWFTHIFIVIFLNIVLAVSYRLLYITGLGSFCHISFYAIGAYTSAILLTRLGLPFGVGFLAAGIVAALASLLLGWPAMRTRGAYFFIVSFGFFVIFYAILMNWFELTGGYAGIMQIPPVLSSITTGALKPNYYLILAFCAVTILIMYRLDKSRYGQELYAIGDAENLAEVVGINILRHRLFAFGLGAMFAGFAGSMHASYYAYIAPPAFSMITTIIILAWVVVGGSQKLWGPIVAAVALTLFAELLRMSGPLSGILYGVVLFIFVMTMPRGVVGAVDSFRARFRKHESLYETTK